jgi:hypothetical protein
VGEKETIGEKERRRRVGEKSKESKESRRVGLGDILLKG